MLAEFFEDLADAFVTKDDDTTVRQQDGERWRRGVEMIKK
jgi:hypothetical protein